MKFLFQIIIAELKITHIIFIFQFFLIIFFDLGPPRIRRRSRMRFRGPLPIPSRRRVEENFTMTASE